MSANNGERVNGCSSCESLLCLLSVSIALWEDGAARVDFDDFGTGLEEGRREL